MEKFFTTGFNFNEFIFVYVVNIRFIYDGEIQLLTHGYLCWGTNDLESALQN